MSRERPRVRRIADFQFDFTGLRVSLQRGFFGAEREHYRFEKRRPVGGISASQDGHSRFERHFGLGDTADITGVNRYVSFLNLLRIHGLTFGCSHLKISEDLSGRSGSRTSPYHRLYVLGAMASIRRFRTKPFRRWNSDI
jgi:hypothetical protein